jgi:uncharacterized secreted protein with C-terminal beta-propeller domain
MPLAQLRRTTALTLIAAGLAVSLAGAPTASAEGSPRYGANAPQKTLKPFSSERELIKFLKKRQPKPSTRKSGAGGPPPPAPAPMAAAEAAPADASASQAADGITNNQEAGVDEGGIVKMKGDILVVLRRGRGMGAGEAPPHGWAPARARGERAARSPSRR